MREPFCHEQRGHGLRGIRRSAMLTGVCSAQVAADFATNPTYAGGWAAGQKRRFWFRRVEL